jgi:hypothetical protein
LSDAKDSDELRLMKGKWEECFDVFMCGCPVLKNLGIEKKSIRSRIMSPLIKAAGGKMERHPREYGAAVIGPARLNGISLVTPLSHLHENNPEACTVHRLINPSASSL